MAALTLAATSPMNQAARLAPARRRASGLTRALLPPFAPLSLRSGGVRSGRADGLCAKCRARSGGHRARHRPRSLRSRQAPAVECPGPPLRPSGCRERLSRCRASGSACALRFAPALGSGRLRSLQGGRMAPRSREPRARPEESGRWAARGPNGPLRSSPSSFRSARTPARTPPASLHRCGFRAAGADRSGEARSWNTRAQTTPLRCAARRFAPCAYASRSPLRCETRAARPLRGRVALA